MNQETGFKIGQRKEGNENHTVEVSKILSSTVRTLITIDYRCDDEREKKKNYRVGATSWYHCVADDSSIPKMPVISPLQALVHPQTQKNHSAWIVNHQPQLLRICLFWFIDMQIRNCRFQSSKQLMS
jgi:hypothetical protein